MFSTYPGFHKVQCELPYCFWSLDIGMMWWYNILGDNEGSISHILQLDPITLGYIFLTANLVSLKMENSDPILIVKRTEWSKFTDYFGLSIEADPSKVDKKNIHFVCIGSI